MAQAVNASLDLPEVLRRVLEAMREAFGFEHSMVLLPVEDEALEVRASVGYAETGVGARVKMSEGPIGVVVQRKKLLRIASMFATVRYALALDPNARSALPGLAKVESLIVVPMLIESELVGVLYIESAERLAFEAEDEALVTAVANLAAAAIRNARLYQDVVDTHRSGQRFVPHEFVRFLDKKKLTDLARGQSVSRVMTILFSDLRSFTSAVEKLDPAATFDLLNGYFAAMVPSIQAERGFVDKFIGDAIMALFDEATPDGALRAAVGQHHALDRLNEQRGGHALSMGLGLHTGPLTLGVVGSDERLSCTVYGDSVNLASRVEGLTRAYGARVLLTGATRAALAEPDAFELRYVDRVRVKGKEQAVELWECLTALPEAERTHRAPAGAMQEARAPYDAGQFQEAVARLEALGARFAADPLIRVLLERSRELQARPPEHWDGALRLDKK